MPEDDVFVNDWLGPEDESMDAEGEREFLAEARLWRPIARQRLSQVSFVLCVVFSVGKLSIYTQMGQFHACPRISTHMHRMSFRTLIL